MSLPIGARTIINAKALIATLTFIPVPLALLAIGLSKNVVSSYILMIPFVELIHYWCCLRWRNRLLCETARRQKRTSPIAGL